LKIEMIDRFGLLPEAGKLLFEVTLLKLYAESLGIQKIEANARFGKVLFNNDTEVDPYSIVKLVQDNSRVYSLSGATELKFRHNLDDARERITFVKQLLNTLTPEPLEVA